MTTSLRFYSCEPTHLKSRSCRDQHMLFPFYLLSIEVVVHISEHFVGYSQATDPKIPARAEGSRVPVVTRGSIRWITSTDLAYQKIVYCCSPVLEGGLLVSNLIFQLLEDVCQFRSLICAPSNKSHSRSFWSAISYSR